MNRSSETPSSERSSSAEPNKSLANNVQKSSKSGSKSSPSVFHRVFALFKLSFITKYLPSLKLLSFISSIKPSEERLQRLLPLLSALFLTIFSYGIFADLIVFSGPTLVADLADFLGKIKFTLRLQTLHLFWLSYSMFWMVSKRLSPSSTPDGISLAEEHFNDNLAQYFMSLLSQLVMITYLDAQGCLKYVPAVNILFFIGRFTNWLGLPKFKSFGAVINDATQYALLAFNLLKFVEWYKLF